jgi:FlaA1/EpsC-like NDP-sugar epimerase
MHNRISILNKKAMIRHFRNRYFAAFDIALLAMAAYLSYVLRLEQFDLRGFWPSFYVFAALAAVVTPLVFWWTGVYSRYWRYASAEEMLLLIGSTTIATVAIGALSYALVTALPGDYTVPRSIPFIFLLLALAVTAGPRLAARLFAHDSKQPKADTKSVRVLVMGAGAAGAMIVRELQSNPQLRMMVVGFLDDDRSKQKVRIRGVRVLGTRHDLPKVVEEQRVERVIIAMPTASGKTIREIVSLCEQVGVQIKIIPGIYELLSGTVSVSQLRNVEIEDLLRRGTIETDIAAVQALIRGKCVLVTGGGGSIGSELCRQVIRCAPRQLVIIGHGENSVFEIESELRKTVAGGEGGHPEIATVIADIRFTERMRFIFEQYRPNIVFHAAAHKHVQLMETNPGEAITNNVLGTRNLLEASRAVGVERFVMISTDKAVNPTGVYGASKRVAEQLVHQAAEQAGKAYVTVRFGNVLGSRGSVVLTFKKQIAEGGPITITHPDMMRYFMTIPEAVQLVLQAAALGRGGEVFMLDMGEPMRIEDLARDLVELSGLEVGRDIDITFTGIRPGEKLFEEMFSTNEHYERTQHEKIFIADNATHTASLHLDEGITELSEAAWSNDEQAILASLNRLVPEFQHADREVASTPASHKRSELPTEAERVSV